MKKIITLLLILSLASCVKNNDDGTHDNLPSITKVGRNTFGCLVDGEVFLPRVRGGFSIGYRPSALSARYFYLENDYYELGAGYHLVIDAYNELTKKDITIKLSALDVPLEVGVYPITLRSSGNFSGEYSYSKNTPHPDYDNVIIYNQYNYVTTEEYFGEVEILKVDETNLIISGTFSFQCIDTITNNYASIISGRFDVVYEPYPY